MNMEALWSEGFPGPASQSRARCFICDKCNRSCRLLTSSTPKNPGRQFYICDFDHAKFFKWADEVKPHELIEVPHCGGCAAGVCRVQRVKGRILFMCRVKEGEGSCGYRVWQDELQKSEESLSLFQARVADCNGTSTTVSDDERTGNVSPSSDDLLCREVTPQRMDHQVILKPLSLNEPETIPRVKCLEDNSNITSRRPQKRSRYGDIIAASYPPEFTFVVEDILENSCGSTINPKEFESYRNHSFNLEQHHNPLDQILVNSSDGSSHLLGAESYSRPLISHSAEISLPISRNEASPVVDPLPKTGVMSDSISSILNQAAECLQNKLLNLLETMDVKDHEPMSHEAEATFAALDRLLFDHQLLKKRAKELIHCASSLVEIQQSMPENVSYQKMAEHCCNERVRLDEIKRVHDEAVEAALKNKRRLKDVQEEISSTMEWLLQLEDEVACCEAKMKHFELELNKIAKKKEALEESQKLLEQKEAELSAAKAAFERARAFLRV